MFTAAPAQVGPGRYRENVLADEIPTVVLNYIHLCSVVALIA